MSKTTLTHPQLGTVTGIRVSDSATQFRGLKYATVPARFAPAELFKPNNPDGTSFSPSANQIPGTCSGELSFLQVDLPQPPTCNEFSEFDCLHLNVTVPANCTPPPKGFPVVVVVHGGSHLIGANCWPELQPEGLVALASARGKPIIAVNINYRLGLFGMLTATELRPLGVVGNAPVRDAIVAFDWVRQFIRGFGGNPAAITALGESAGSITVTALLQYSEKLFSRAVTLSGELPMLPPKDIAWHDTEYTKLLAEFGLQELQTPEERLAALREIPEEEFTAKTFGQGRLACDDLLSAATLSEYRDVAKIPGYGWCEAILKGFCSDDGAIIEFITAGNSEKYVAQFQEYLESQEAAGADSETVAKIRADISEIVDLEPEEAYVALCRYLGDVLFGNSALTALDAARKHTKVYAYEFGIGNPFPGKYKGRAVHIMDMVCTLQSIVPKLPEPERIEAEEWGGYVVDFVYGEEPWEAYNKRGYQKSVGRAVRGDKVIRLNPEEAERYVKLLSPFVFG